MALLFLDTSALVKLYVQEVGSERMVELAHPDSGNSLAIVSLSRLEFRAAVRRRTKLGDMNASLADRLLHAFAEHLASVFQVLPVNDILLSEAAGVIDRHSLRTYDAVQLGGCLALRLTVGNEVETRFVCADEELLEAAHTEGLVAINPCHA